MPIAQIRSANAPTTGSRITNTTRTQYRALDLIREFLKADGHELVYRQFIAPGSNTIQFSSALNRSVTGSTNDLINAKSCLIEKALSTFDVAVELNQAPMSLLAYRNPREVFQSLKSAPPESGQASFGAIVT